MDINVRQAMEMTNGDLREYLSEENYNKQDLRELLYKVISEANTYKKLYESEKKTREESYEIVQKAKSFLEKI